MAYLINNGEVIEAGNQTNKITNGIAKIMAKMAAKRRNGVENNGAGA